MQQVQQRRSFVEQPGQLGGGVARSWTRADAEALCDPDREHREETTYDVYKHVGGHLLKHNKFLRLQQNAKLMRQTYSAGQAAAAAAAAAATTREKRKSPMAAHHGVTTRQDIEESDRRIKRLRQALAQTKIAVKAVQADTKAVVESDEQRMQWIKELWRKLDEALMPEEVLALRRDIAAFFGTPIEVQFER